MSNMQMREKVRKITEAANDSKQISEESKKAGMLMFFILSGLCLLALVCFSLALLIYQHYLSAFISIIVTACFSYLLYKIQSADEIPKD